ncbi:MAG: tRNA pseudouridine38-40 synthase [Halobacteriales archaeon]|jgi:tRNA pseudouridine38-40 synthase
MDAYRISYDGRPFHGFQRQPDVPTVEDALFDALRSLDVLGETDDTPPEYAAAGRTDAGVSALGQVVAFESPDWLSPAPLNGTLPNSIRAWDRSDAPDGFHARHDADWREYAYHLHAPEIDTDLATEVCARLEGTHDFHNFTAEDGETIRKVHEAAVDREGEYLVLRVRADGFLRHQLRRMVALIEAIGTGERPLALVDRALDSEPLSGPQGIPTAPPEPLVLLNVGYPDLEFEVDGEAAMQARRAFDHRRIRHSTAARVAGTIRDGIDGKE